MSRMIWFSDTKLGDMTLSYVELYLALFLHSYIVYLYFKLKDAALYIETPAYMRWYTLAALAFVLSMIFHPGPKGNYFFT